MRWATISLVFVVSCRFDLPEPPECRVDDECGAHEFCGGGACECVAGYARGPAGCSWLGVVADPGFTDPLAWSALSTAVVNDIALEPAMNDPGFGRLPRGDCAATLQQRIVMPSFARSEALVASLTYRVPDTQGADGAPSFAVENAWSIARSPTFMSNIWTTVRRCLGVGHYAAEGSTGPGQEVTLSVGRSDLGCPYDSVEIDRFEIVPAIPGECPDPGQVLNGSAEEGGGWTFEASDGGQAGFVAGIGEFGTRAVRLANPLRCSRGSAEVPFSPGLIGESGSPALSYYLAMTGPLLLYGSFERFSLQSVPSGPTRIVRFCVPAHLRGTSSRFGSGSMFDGTTSGMCTDPINGSAVIDTVKVENVPECGTDPGIADPGFEMGTLIDAGGHARGTTQSVAAAGTHSGARMLEMKVNECGAFTTIYLHVIAPPASAGGPAFTFWARIPPGSYSNLRAGHFSGSVAVTRDPQWKQHKLCLDPKLAGRYQMVYFDFSTFNTGCGGSFPAESAFIDDLAVTTDPACPAM